MLEQKQRQMLVRTVKSSSSSVVCFLDITTFQFLFSLKGFHGSYLLDSLLLGDWFSEVTCDWKRVQVANLTLWPKCASQKRISSWFFLAGSAFNESLKEAAFLSSMTKWENDVVKRLPLIAINASCILFLSSIMQRALPSIHSFIHPRMNQKWAFNIASFLGG